MLLLIAAAAFACESPLPNAALQARVDAALALYEQYEVPDFRRAASALEADIACASEPLDPALAARVHLVVGMGLWHGEDGRSRATQAWTAARTLDPAYVAPEWLFPLGQPERLIWDGIGAQPAAVRPLPDGAWWVDGAPAAVLPTDRPSVVQQVGEGSPRSAYAWPGAAWPPAPEPPAPGPGLRPVALGLASVGVAGVGAAMWTDAYRVYNTEDFRVAYYEASPQFMTWWDEQFAPRWYGGIALMAVGGAGMAASGAWLALTPRGISAGGRF